MSKNKLVRVAFVRYSPNDKSYPALCERKDMVVGDKVEVLMRARSKDTYSMQGTVDQIEYRRWSYSCIVEFLAKETEYFFTEDGKFDRRINLSANLDADDAERIRNRRGYYEGLPAFARDEMREIYEAAAGEDGEAAYLGDGVWITPNGRLEDRS